MSAPLNSKTARELVEAYQSIYTTEEVVEETQDELEEGVLDWINNYKRKPMGQDTPNINKAASNLMKSGGIGGAISRGVQSAQSRARNALGLNAPPKVNPGEKYGPGDGAAAASRGTIGGLIKKDSTSSQGSSTQQSAARPAARPATSSSQGSSTPEPAAKPAAKPATAGTYSSQFKKSAPALSKTLTKKEPTMKSDLGGRLGKALSGKVSDFQFKDSYDMVLDYLLSGGHVESVEEAHYVMLEMDQETIQGICEMVNEGLTGERYKEALKKGKQYSRRVSEDPAKRATRGGRGGESDFGAGDRGTGNKSRRRRGLPVGDED